LEISVHNIEGEVVSQIEIDEYIFGVPSNEAVVHQALVRQWANARVGTADTKTRGEVQGSSRKLFRQKGTGFARAGSRRSPIRRGGGVAFGPHPRSYRKSMPKKMRRLALRCVLSSKVANEELYVIDSFGLEKPKTKEMVNALEPIGIKNRALVVTAEADSIVVKSARSIENVKVLTANMLNVVDLLSCKTAILTVDAVRKIESIWGKAKVEVEA